MIDLTGRTAVVTGGSRGIGRASVILLARAGANIVFGYRSDSESARSLEKELENLGRPPVACAGDIATGETVEMLFREAHRAFGDVDIVVSNAGIWKHSPIDEMTEEEWHETLDTNLTSAFLICRAAARLMKIKRSGTIILVGSTAGQRGEAFHSHYAASKGGLVALMKSLAVELAPWNIRVNVVAPGWVMTDMVSGVLEDPTQRQMIEKETPLGRIATPRDIAGTILFLASDLAGHVHGEVLNVNGGSVLCG